MSKDAMSAKEVLSDADYQLLIEAQKDHTRRTPNSSGVPYVETTVSPGDLWQSVDIAVDGDNFGKQQIPSLPDYYLYDRDSGIKFIEECMQLGISGIMLRPIVTKKRKGLHTSEYEMHRAIENAAIIVSTVKEKICQCFVAVDPFDLPDYRGSTWGVFDEGKGLKRKIDSTKTYDVIAFMAATIGQAKADMFMTIGRLREEALVAKASLNRHAPNTKLGSFSSNNETRLAYSYACHMDGVYLFSGQKIPVGNFNEMILRTLADMAEGVELALTKPSPNTHVNAILSAVLSGEIPLDSFLRKGEVQQLLELDPMLVKHIDRFRERYTVIRKAVKLGGYNVSGTYSHWKSVEGAQDEDRFDECASTGLSYVLAHENYRNIIAASSPFFGHIADRFAHQFVKNQNYWGTPRGF